MVVDSGSMWIRIFLVLFLTKLSEETCKKVYTYQPFRRLETYMSCTNISTKTNYDLNSDILSKMEKTMEDFVITNSNIPELSQEMFRNVSFINMTLRANVEIVQSRAFENCKVTTLVLDYNDIKIIKDMSFNSPSIHLLSLQNNSLNEIKVNNLYGLSGLKKLNLKYNMITDIDEDSFNSLTSLEEIDLSFNQLVELNFGQFQLTTRLRIIHLNNNLLKGLSDHIFSQCKALQYLNIANNVITIIDARNYPNSLHYIDASNNQLMSVDFSNLINADTINLDSNNLVSITDSLYNSTSLNDLSLKNNSLGPSIDIKTFRQLTKLTSISLDGNGLQQIDFELFNNLTFLKIVSLAVNNLTILDLSNINLPLTTLNLTRNFFNDIKNMSKLVNLRILDLSYNNLEEIKYDTFENLTYIVKLLLHHNSIHFLRLGCFRDLRKMQEINLSHNKIDNLEAGTFTGLLEVNTLDLSYNNLLYMDEHILHDLKRLTNLNIAYNKLSRFDSNVLQSQTFFPRRITLDGNNWTCKYLVDITKKHFSVTRGNSFNVTNVLGIPCNNTDDSKRSNQTCMYLESIEGYAKQISSKMTLLIVVLIVLLVLFCLRFSYVKCCTCYTAAMQFVYKRYRDEQEIQLT